ASAPAASTRARTSGSSTVQATTGAPRACAAPTLPAVTSVGGSPTPRGRGQPGCPERRPAAVFRDPEHSARKRDPGANRGVVRAHGTRRAEIEAADEAPPLQAVAPNRLDDVALTPAHLQVDVGTHSGRLADEESE